MKLDPILSGRKGGIAQDLKMFTADIPPPLP